MVKRRIQTTGRSTKDLDPNTLCVDGKLLLKRYRKLVKSLEGMLVKASKDRLVFNYKQKACTAKPADIVRVLSEWSQNDLVDLTIRNIIVDTILSSENKQIGSGLICAMALISSCEEYGQFYKTRATREDIHDSIDYMVGKGIVSTVTKEIIKTGTLGTSLTFPESFNRHFTIETDTSVKIYGGVSPMFENLPSHKIESPFIICVDGVIESLGEIDSILQTAAETKSYVILCASGFHPDVVYTLSENWKEGRLKVFPFGASLWDPNDPDIGPIEFCTKNDIVCVSTQTGHSLLTQKLEDFTQTKSAYFGKNHLAIQSGSGDNFYTQVLVPKNMAGLRGLIEDRVKIAMSNCVAIAKYGTAVDSNLKKQFDKIGVPYPIVSTKAHEIGIRTALSCKKNLKDLGAAIIPEIK